MPAYSAPTAEQVRNIHGLLKEIEGNATDNALDQRLDELLPAAEGQVALWATQAKFTSTGLTVYEAAALQEAVAYGVAWRFLVSPFTQRAVGVNQPHLFAEGDGSVQDVIAWLQEQSKQIATLLASGEGAAVLEVRQPFTSGDVGDTSELRVFSRGMVW